MDCDGPAEAGHYRNDSLFDREYESMLPAACHRSVGVGWHERGTNDAAPPHLLDKSRPRMPPGPSSVANPWHAV